MTEWQDLTDDEDDSPFGEPPVDAIVYADDETSPELQMGDRVRDAASPVPARPVPRKRSHRSYGAWQPAAPEPAPVRGPRGPSRARVIVVALLPLAALALLVWLFVAVYRGDVLGTGTVPSRPGEQTPAVTAPPNLPPSPAGPAAPR